MVGIFQNCGTPQKDPSKNFEWDVEFDTLFGGYPLSTVPTKGWAMP